MNLNHYRPAQGFWSFYCQVLKADGLRIIGVIVAIEGIYALVYFVVAVASRSVADVMLDYVMNHPPVVIGTTVVAAVWVFLVSTHQHALRAMDDGSIRLSPVDIDVTARVMDPKEAEYHKAAVKWDFSGRFYADIDSPLTIPNHNAFVVITVTGATSQLQQLRLTVWGVSGQYDGIDQQVHLSHPDYFHITASGFMKQSDVDHVGEFSRVRCDIRLFPAQVGDQHCELNGTLVAPHKGHTQWVYAPGANDWTFRWKRGTTPTFNQTT